MLPPLHRQLDAVFGAISSWILDSPRPIQTPQDLVLLMQYKFARVMKERNEIFHAEYVGAVRNLEATMPNIVSLEGAYLHLNQEAPHVHAYYQRKFVPEVTRSSVRPSLILERKKWQGGARNRIDWYH